MPRPRDAPAGRSRHRPTPPVVAGEEWTLRTTLSRTGRWITDAAVLAAVVSVAASAALLGWEPALRFAVIMALLLYVRRGDVPPPFAAAFGTLVLVATWASVRHWYREVEHFDLVVHLLAPGALAGAACFVAVAWRWLPPFPPARSRARAGAPILWTTVLGTTAAVVWELYEWVVELWASRTVIVGYTDTIADLAAGMLSSLAAGVLVTRWVRHRRPTSDALPASVPTSASR